VTKPKELHCGYFDELFDPAKFVTKATKDLFDHTHEFDLMVGTGVSGALAIGMLAFALQKRFVIVRKENDGSHSSHPIEGLVASGDRWLFVDDFISTGKTFRRCSDAMQSIGMGLVFAGTYSYHHGHGGLVLGKRPRDWNNREIV
jgi:orotate phosphoribosyltransferase